MEDRKREFDDSVLGALAVAKAAADDFDRRGINCALTPHIGCQALKVLAFALVAERKKNNLSDKYEALGRAAEEAAKLLKFMGEYYIHESSHAHFEYSPDGALPKLEAALSALQEAKKSLPKEP